MEQLITFIDKFTKENIKDLGFTVLPTGIDSIDRVMGGGLRPGVTVLGAAPGVGKTTLALQIGLNISISGTPVLLFSLEVPKYRILSKLLSHTLYNPYSSRSDSNISSAQMLNQECSNNFSDLQWHLIDNARARLQKDAANIFIRDTEISAEDIVREVKDFKEQNKAESLLVIVDYLQFLSKGQNQMFTERQAVDYSVKKLTDFANENRIHVLLISALSRVGYEGEALSMSSFKESGSIEYSADTLIGMDTTWDGGSMKTIKLDFLKQRYGQTNVRILLNYYPQYDTFEDIEGQEIQTLGDVKKKKSSRKSSEEKKEENTSLSEEQSKRMEKFYSLEEDKRK